MLESYVQGNDEGDAKMTTAIYALVDPRTDAVKYVGKTKNTSARLAKHNQAPGSKRLSRWLDDLRSVGAFPVLRVLESVDDSVAANAESFWIRYMNAVTDEALLNCSRPNVDRNIEWHSQVLDHECAEKFCADYYRRKAFEAVLAVHGLTLADFDVKASIEDRVNRHFGEFDNEVRSEMISVAWDAFVSRRREERQQAFT